MIMVKINGKEENIEEATILDILKSKNIEPQMVAVELNSKILEKDEFAITKVKDGDNIELLFFMGGGERDEMQLK
ncbi:MAG: sulfur carrier protein ThiS [Nitrospirota bacterium]